MSGAKLRKEIVIGLETFLILGGTYKNGAITSVTIRLNSKGGDILAQGLNFGIMKSGKIYVYEEAKEKIRIGLGKLNYVETEQFTDRLVSDISTMTKSDF